MPYVRRDPEGQLLSLHRQAENGADEFLPDDDPLVQAFVGRDPASGIAPDHLAIDLVGRRHEGPLVQRHLRGLAADEDLHALGELALLQQVEELRLGLEHVERSALGNENY